ncbi:DUF3114 domain-containing protein [Weissella halotolerans]|uniref:DUF3114 domain-containing protein n=1 Tax=Weissella halotolerans DSM 20190 TaxID=1123500 RepID=A0A0R2G759_9LACO|nr:DUF3114 domain-containing protein [Weissella halotolerans]KRN33287.1 hypothetical protein IV68_GL000085 [Weissella halotolerans DSM 20190]
MSVSTKRYQQLKAGLTGTLAKQVEQLHLDGWPDKALWVYVRLTRQVLASRPYSCEQALQRQWFEAHRVGSRLFNRMFLIGFVPMQSKARERIATLYRILGFQVGSGNFLMMTRLGAWSERYLTPNLYYLHVTDAEQLREWFFFSRHIAEMMQVKYRQFVTGWQIKPVDRLLTDIQDNQLRYYLGKPVVDYLGRQPLTRQSLIQFLQMVTRHRVRYPDAHFHNRGLQEPSNVKIVTADYHNEIILDARDRLVSLWQALERHQYMDEFGVVHFSQELVDYDEQDLWQLANTESFNYANHGGQRHNRLDVEPAAWTAGLEPELRNVAKRYFKENKLR